MRLHQCLVRARERGHVFFAVFPSVPITASRRVKQTYFLDRSVAEIFAFAACLAEDLADALVDHGVERTVVIRFIHDRALRPVSKVGKHFPLQVGRGANGEVVVIVHGSRSNALKWSAFPRRCHKERQQARIVVSKYPRESLGSDKITVARVLNRFLTGIPGEWWITVI